MLEPAQAEARLWSLYSPAPRPAQLCTDAEQAGVACIEGEARTWDQLLAYDRPLLLDVITPERFSAAVLLLGIEGRQAWVAAEQGVVLVELAELGPLWSGSYRFLWHPPAGFERPLSLGDSGLVVAQVAGLFARLDAQPQPLTTEDFNAALQQRVRMFQRTHGLEDDGVVGVRTLLKLNELLGVDTTATAARERLQDPVGEVGQR